MRFKTEAEFIAEFNIGWKHMYPAWIHEMNKLFGTTLEPEDEYEMRQLLLRLENVTDHDAAKLTEAAADYLDAFTCTIANFCISAWMVKEDSLDTNSARESLEILYSTYGYDEIALAVLTKAREEQ